MTAMTSLRFDDAPAAHDLASHSVMPGAAGVISSFTGRARCVSPEDLPGHAEFIYNR
jgi:hypothetical protein